MFTSEDKEKWAAYPRVLRTQGKNSARAPDAGPVLSLRPSGILRWLFIIVIMRLDVNKGWSTKPRHNPYCVFFPYKAAGVSGLWRHFKSFWLDCHLLLQPVLCLLRNGVGWVLLTYKQKAVTLTLVFSLDALVNTLCLKLWWPEWGPQVQVEWWKINHPQLAQLNQESVNRRGAVPRIMGR